MKGLFLKFAAVSIITSLGMVIGDCLARAVSVSFDDVSINQNDAVGVFGTVTVDEGETFTPSAYGVQPASFPDLGINAENNGSFESIFVGRELTGPSTGGGIFFIITTENAEVGTTATFTGTVNPGVISDSFEVSVVPEPLTILGSGLALGFGAYFKKEYSRKQKKAKAKA